MINFRTIALLALISFPIFGQPKFIRNKNRPNVDGLEFKAAKSVLKPYLKAIKDPEKKQVEIDRIQQLMFIKEDLSKMMATNPYYTKNRKRILLKKHGKLQFVACTYIKANGSQLNLKTSKNGKFVKLKWSSIPSKTILDMLDFYLKMKIKFAKQKVNTENKGRFSDENIGIADFALRSALFVEWNLGPKHARKHVYIVLKYEPSYVDNIIKFIPKTLQRDFSKKK